MLPNWVRGGSTTPRSSKSPKSPTKQRVKDYIEQICMSEENVYDMAVTQEFVNFINENGGNVPAEVAHQLIKRVTPTRYQHSLRASKILDVLVQKCGYPMHYQVATVPFLRAMTDFDFYQGQIVKNSVLNYNMFLLHMWYNTWADNPRVRDDFVNVKSFHDAVQARGIRFPPEDPATVAKLNAMYNVQTPQEEAKLERLIKKVKFNSFLSKGDKHDMHLAQKLIEELLAERDA
ncbi:ARF-binding protein [Malassezia vespertilionis]|uniref:VHS domain-containing protein n=1 Tax=Malassezia vespertilionis TaxID=2020962 RepID=A0A2N1J8J4_9BASI|nr:ARF-binding protein [Malassezia vespertilionis]PKI82875.1 hypothetical protein MVES_003256 [Malassezia vespertilionis]WFD08322.1 ARF-binding protein [Malassezia vespertilionis]